MTIADYPGCPILQRLVERVMIRWVRTHPTVFGSKRLETINWRLQESIYLARGVEKTAYVTALFRDSEEKINGHIEFKGTGEGGRFLKELPIIYVEIRGRDNEENKWHVDHESFMLEKKDAVALALGATPEGLVDSLVRYIQRGH